MDWFFLIYVFIGLIILRLMINLNNLLVMRNLRKKYMSSIKGECNFNRYKQQLISLCKEAGINDKCIPYQENVGYGRLLTTNVSLFENVGIFHETIFELMANLFAEGDGIFKRRCIESFNPIFWVKFILKLPENLLTYLGVSPDNVLIKIINIVWWLTGIVGTIIYELIKKNVLNL